MPSMPYIRRKNGFTIVELTVVIVVIGILATIVTVAYNGVQRNAYDRGVQSDLEGLAALETQYALKNGTGGKSWYSGDGVDSDLKFTPTSGNVIDVVSNGKYYCIRGYNPKGNKNSIHNAFTKSSGGDSCDTLVASDKAQNRQWTWTAYDTSLTGILNARNDQAVYILGQYGLKSTNQGQSWAALASLPNGVADGAVSTDGNKIAVATSTSVFTSINAGASWTNRSVAPAQYYSWKAIASSADGNKLVVVGPNKVMTSVNGGASWIERTLPESRNWGTVTSSSDGTKLTVGSYGFSESGDKSLYISTNSGATWTRQAVQGTSTYPYDEWYDSAVSADGTKMAFTLNPSYTDRRLSYTTNGGQTWSRGITALKVATSQDGTVLAVSTPNQGNVSVSTDFGASWQERLTSDDNIIDIAVSNDGSRVYVLLLGNNGSGVLKVGRYVSL